MTTTVTAADAAKMKAFDALPPEEQQRILAEVVAKAAAATKGKPLATAEEEFAAKKVVDSLLVWFVHDAPYASQIYYMMEKTTRPGIGTMGVSVKQDRMSLFFDPLFVLALERAEVGFVMLHETFHIMLHHCTGRIPRDQKAHQKWNIAADLAINCLIPRTSTCQMPTWKTVPLDKKGQPVKNPSGVAIKKGARMGILPLDYKLADKKAMEWYFSAVPENPNGGGGDGEGEGEGGEGEGEGGYPGQLDSHDEWEPSDLIDQEIQNTVERISKNRQWGTMPQETINDIHAAQKTEVPWSKILRHALGDLMSKDKRKSIKKINRRVPFYPFKGEVKTGVDKKLVGFDTSGSVGDDELDKFLSEVNRLVEEEQPVDAICFDTEIKGKPVPFFRSKSKYNFKGRGGTCFTAIVEFAKANKYKHLIILTDGEAPCPPHQVGLDIIWVITPDGSDTPPQGYQGRFIKMKKMADKNFRK